MLLQLKRDLRTAYIPVIVISIVDQPAIGTTLGADEYLVKPVDKASLLAAVRRCLALKARSRRVTATDLGGRGRHSNPRGRRRVAHGAGVCRDDC